jgi:hypothetical protein
MHLLSQLVLYEIHEYSTAVVEHLRMKLVAAAELIVYP